MTDPSSLHLADKSTSPNNSPATHAASTRTTGTCGAACSPTTPSSTTARPTAGPPPAATIWPTGSPRACRSCPGSSTTSPTSKSTSTATPPTSAPFFYNPMQLPGLAESSACGGYYHHDFVRTPSGWKSRHLIEESCWFVNPYPTPTEQDHPHDRRRRQRDRRRRSRTSSRPGPVGRPVRLFAALRPVPGQGRDAPRRNDADRLDEVVQVYNDSDHFSACVVVTGRSPGPRPIGPTTTPMR